MAICVDLCAAVTLGPLSQGAKRRCVTWKQHFLSQPLRVVVATAVADGIDEPPAWCCGEIRGSCRFSTEFAVRNVGEA